MKYNSIQFKGQKLRLTSLLNVGKIVILGRMKDKLSWISK